MEMTNDQSKLIIELTKDKANKFYAWFKQILIIATGLFSVLVSLHKNTSSNIYEHWLFSIAIISLGLGILTGCIFLFAEADIPRKAALNFLKQIAEQKEHGTRPEKIIFEGPSKLHAACKYISYISFSIAIIVLVWYAVQLDH